MNTVDFDYHLPEELIATRPAQPRDASRLLVYRRDTREITHATFRDLPTFLTRGDSLVLNKSKVIPARLRGKDRESRDCEIFLLKQKSPGRWRCLVKPGKRVKPTLEVLLPDGESLVVERTEQDEFEVTLPPRDGWLETHGEPPLPPYIKRTIEPRDKSTYQTIFAETPGSVAAPTAGLHFTEETFRLLESAGVSTHFLHLHVGYGTFAPLKEGDFTAQKLHSEIYEIPAGLLDRLRKVKDEGGRVIPVGTTSLRALESSTFYGIAGETDLFITPGFRFAWADGMVTNFHLPKSSLFVLVASLIGLEETRRCYQIAIKERYRFYSYGDAMLIL